MINKIDDKEKAARAHYIRQAAEGYGVEKSRMSSDEIESTRQANIDKDRLEIEVMEKRLGFDLLHKKGSVEEIVEPTSYYGTTAHNAFTPPTLSVYNDTYIEVNQPKSKAKKVELSEEVDDELGEGVEAEIDAEIARSEVISNAKKEFIRIAQQNIEQDW